MLEDARTAAITFVVIVMGCGTYYLLFEFGNDIDFRAVALVFMALVCFIGSIFGFALGVFFGCYAEFKKAIPAFAIAAGCVLAMDRLIQMSGHG